VPKIFIPDAYGTGTKNEHLKPLPENSWFTAQVSWACDMGLTLGEHTTGLLSHFKLSLCIKTVSGSSYGPTTEPTRHSNIQVQLLSKNKTSRT